MNSQHHLAQIILRSWPFPRGAGRIIDHYFSKTKFDQKTATVRTTDGFDICVEPNDLIGRHIYLTGEFDRSIVELLCNFANAGDVLLDIGANVGYVSACFLQNVKDSSVIAVEPQAGIVDLLRANLASFQRHQIYPFALGETNGPVRFEIDQLNKGAGRVSANGNLIVEMRTGDRMLIELGISKVDIIKIDVEGLEEQVLRSCLPMIDGLKPNSIIFEGHLADSFPVVDLLSRLGYVSYGIKKHLTKLGLHRIKKETDCIHHDYVAIADWRLVPARAKKIYGSPGSGIFN